MAHRRMFRALLSAVAGIRILSPCIASESQMPLNTPTASSTIRIHDFVPESPLSRAMRTTTIAASIDNDSDRTIEVQPQLILPDGVRLAQPDRNVRVTIEDGGRTTLHWDIQADRSGTFSLRLNVVAAGATAATMSLSMQFLPPMEIRKLPYIPEPQPVQTSILIGAHNCPLWEADKPGMWANIRKHPERTPALGFYSQENPEVSDWETKWAVEHGVSFFIYCWYRASQGKPVQMHFGSAIHDGLFKSKFQSKMKFTIMWENQSRGTAGVTDENDLMTNLLPFWIDTYFKNPGYLKVDNKPLLFVYRPEFLIQDLGSVENVAKAFDKMRKACKDAGFAGLTILGEYRGLDPNHLRLMKQLGLDNCFAYCWYIGNNPTPQQAIDTQMSNIHKTQDLGILPQVVTVSQAWSGWSDEGTIWKIPPADYETLLRKAKDFISGLPPDQLGSKMLLLDNWNEWGEGHYIAPYREYGFGYLDAVRNVFSSAPEPHVDLLPEDIGLGPYDQAYRANQQRAEELGNLVSRKVTLPGANEDGLIGWWTFDEDPKSPVALDYSGHRLGGILQGAERAKGVRGSALLCKGGCVLVGANPLLSVTTAMTIACWVKTDLPGQDNKWFINRVFGGGASTGFRMGVLAGKPCFEIPQTDWSHHLMADIDLPTGQWVRLAGTFDGKTMRIYVNGKEHGTMDRPGLIKPNEFHLCLGSYEENHPAHFTGLLDEVKLYNRALTAEEIGRS